MPTLLLAHIDSAFLPHQKFTRATSPEALSPSLLRSLGSPFSDDLPKLKGPVTLPLFSGSELSNCDENITPNCLRALYNIDYKPVATNKNTFGIGGFGQLLPCI